MKLYLAPEVLKADFLDDLNSCDSFLGIAGYIMTSDYLRGMARSKLKKSKLVTTPVDENTNPIALKDILSLGLESLYFYPPVRRMHAKIWVFSKKGQPTTVYVGSANLSLSAFEKNVEGVVRFGIDEGDQDAITEMNSEISSQFADELLIKLDHEKIDDFAKNRKKWLEANQGDEIDNSGAWHKLGYLENHDFWKSGKFTVSVYHGAKNDKNVLKFREAAQSSVVQADVEFRVINPKTNRLLKIAKSELVKFGKDSRATKPVPGMASIFSRIGYNSLKARRFTNKEEWMKWHNSPAIKGRWNNKDMYYNIAVTKRGKFIITVALR